MWASLQKLSERVALAGGILMVVVAVMVTVSVTLRSPWIGGRGVPGDFELVQMGTAVAAFTFLAVCQARRGNIFVDTFTGWLPTQFQHALDAFWDVVYGLAMAVIAWRLLQGAVGEFSTGTTTMVLGLPTGYAIAACGVLAVLVSLVAFVGAFAHVQQHEQAKP
jgi:TRAP-type C4-dicarboxylate transport system permease small subunit